MANSDLLDGILDAAARNAQRHDDASEDGDFNRGSSRYNAGTAVTGGLCALAFLSPIAMVALPSLDNPFGLRQNQMTCGVDCDGMLVSLAFRLAVLAIGSWAVFFRYVNLCSCATRPNILWTKG